MSASMNWMAWCWAMGTPKLLRSLAYSTLRSNAARAMPMAWHAMPMRPPSSVAMATLKPSPTLPTTFSSGTSTLSKNTVHEWAAWIPSLWSGAFCE